MAKRQQVATARRRLRVAARLHRGGEYRVAVDRLPRVIGRPFTLDGSPRADRTWILPNLGIQPRIDGLRLQPEARAGQ